jgi:hypothetical protein
MDAAMRSMKAKIKKMHGYREGHLESQQIFRHLNVMELKALAKLNGVNNYSNKNRKDLEYGIGTFWKMNPEMIKP